MTDARQTPPAGTIKAFTGLATGTSPRRIAELLKVYQAGQAESTAGADEKPGIEGEGKPETTP